MKESNKRLDFLDCIRGLAALAVFMEHAGDRLWPHFNEFTHDSFSVGKFGVAAFFLTSGFVIPFSLERGNSLKAFWISRFFRLYPLYWLSIAVVSGLYLLGVSVVDSAYPLHMARNAMINLTMFQEFVKVPDAEPLYYTLAMEMVFYVSFSVLFVTKLNHYSLRIAWLGCAALSVVGIAAPLLLHRRVPLAGLFYFLCLSVGTSVYRNFRGEVSGRMLTALIGCILLGGIIEIYCNYAFVKKDDLTERFTFWAVFLPWFGAYVLFLGAYLLRAHRFPRMLVWLGTISYSLYLLHSPFVVLVPRWSNLFFSFAVMLAVMIMGSSLTYLLVEKPFIDWGKRIQIQVTRLPEAAIAIERPAAASAPRLEAEV
jgi:peptidoglycan/LPS O-acetylase OafA/YrhL